MHFHENFPKGCIPHCEDGSVHVCLRVIHMNVCYFLSQEETRLSLHAISGLQAA